MDYEHIDRKGGADSGRLEGMRTTVQILGISETKKIDRGSIQNNR